MNDQDMTNEWCVVYPKIGDAYLFHKINNAIEGETTWSLISYSIDPNLEKTWVRPFIDLFTAVNSSAMIKGRLVTDINCFELSEKYYNGVSTSNIIKYMEEYLNNGTRFS